MKLIRFTLISIVAMFAIASFIGILLPSTVLVSRAVNISATKEVISPLVQNIAEWKKWMDGMDNPSVVIHSARSADLNGTQVSITGITDSTIISSWVTRKGKEQVSTIRLISNPEEKITIVQWQFEEKIQWYPWERLGSMMNDKILGPMMETNLNRLKTIGEKTTPISSGPVK